MKRQISILVLFTTCLVFLLFGVYNAGIGPVLQELAERTGSNLAAIGVIFTAIYTGSLLTQFTSGFLTSRYGRIRIMIFSVLFMSLGILGMSFAGSLTLLIAACFVLGLGQGGVDIVSNILVVEAYPQKKVQVLNVLHILYGVGATIGPLLISLTLRKIGQGLIVQRVVAVILMSTLIAFFYIQKRLPKEMEANSEIDSHASQTGTTPLLKDSVVWLLGLLLSLVVGTQFSAGSWANVFLTETYHSTPAKAATITSLYWLLISVARIIAIPLAKYVSQTKIMFINIVGSIAAALFFLITIGQENYSITALLSISLFFGGLYPLFLAFIPEYFGKNFDKASSIIVSLGTVGGLILPWLAGLILNKIGAKPYALLILLSMGLILVMAIPLSKKLRDRQEQS